MSISSQQFCALTSLLKQETAVVLGEGREYLIQTRLSGIAREEDFQSLSDLVDYTLLHPQSPVAQKVLLALTTAETSFFRDLHPFEALQQTLLPQIFARNAKKRSLNIWSIGCASGQEVYSIAMLLAENFPERETWNIKIVGSDINPQLIQQAKSGLYSALEINRGLPSRLLVKYFTQTPRGFQICDTIRSRVSFVQQGVMSSWTPFHADIIMCRNLLIYFDVLTRRRVLELIYSALKPDGVLIMGTAETTRHIHTGFTSADIPGANAFRKLRICPLNKGKATDKQPSVRD